MPEIDFPSPFLKVIKDVKSGDIIKFIDAGTKNKDGDWIFTIEVEGKRDDEGNDLVKKFQLNKTNWKIISKEYGTNSDNWIDKSFQVVIIKTQNPQGEIVDAIRFTIPNKDDDNEIIIE